MDLLGGLSEDKGQNQDVLDLLDGIDEAGGKSFIPEAAGDGIQGTVKAVSTTSSDYSSETVPVVNLTAAKVIVNGKDVSSESEEWRITAYASVLKRELQDANPEAGDLLAVKFFGKKQGKGAHPYSHYKAAVRKA